MSHVKKQEMAMIIGLRSYEIGSKIISWQRKSKDTF